MSIRETTGATSGDSPGGSAGGDLGGSYPNPDVAKVKGIAISAVAPSAGQVLTATGAAAADWETPAGGSPSGAAGGDLSGTYPNPTVATVAASTAANVHSAELAANAATNLNTASTIVKRDGSGNFSAGAITASLTGNASTASLATASNGLKSASTTVVVSAATAPTAGQVLTAASGTAANWATPSGSSPAGMTTQIQFNSSGSFGADANLLFDASANVPYGSLKIGTGSAQTGSLEVRGTTSPVAIGGDNNIIVFTDGVNAGGFLKVTADPLVVFETNSALTLVSLGTNSIFCSAGQVSINNNLIPAAFTLDVNGDINAATNLYHGGTLAVFPLAFSSSASVGGASTETLTVTGLLATDTILAVSQKISGANSVAITGWANQANNALDITWTADPGASAVILVAVSR